MADRWVPPPGANAYNYHCSCWQRVSHGHSNACNERLVAQLAETQAQLTQAQAEMAALRECLGAIASNTKPLPVDTPRRLDKLEFIRRVVCDLAEATLKEAT